MIGLGLDTTMDMALRNNFENNFTWELYHQGGYSFRRNNSTKRNRKSRMSIRRTKRYQRRFAQRHNRK